MLIPAGGAAPGPPLGPVLGQRGVPIGAFCQDFNERTRSVRPGVPLRVRLRVRPDRTYELSIGPPPTSYFLKAAAGIEKGAGRPGHEEGGLLSLKHIYEVAAARWGGDEELRRRGGGSVRAFVGSVLGTARSLGIRVQPRVTPEDVAASQERRRAAQAAAEGGAAEEVGGGAKKK